MTTRRRDSQKTKVYRSEWAIQAQQIGFRHSAPQDGYESLEACEKFLLGVIARKHVQNRYPRASRFQAVHLKPGQGTKAARYDGTYATRLFKSDYGPEFNLPRWARNELTMLHELAHSLVPGGVQHNWEFTECLLWLVRQAMGIEWHDRLLDQYKTRKVKYKKPRERKPVSPERRAELAQQLVAARAARAANRLEKV